MNKKPTINKRSNKKTQKNSQQHLLNESQHDEHYFAQYLQGRSQLSELYHSTETPEPSEQLSQTILMAAKKEAEKNHWWTKPGSWAATIAIVSLVGLLTLNTWQAERQEVLQMSSEEKRQQQSLPTTMLKEKLDSRSNSVPESRSATRKIIRDDEKNDSRKLIFKSAPAPVLQSIPGNQSSNKTGASLTENNFDAIQSLSSQPIQTPVTSHQELKSDKVFSDKQQTLAKIKQLIENNQLEEARQLLAQFQEIYPNYPIDTVILQHLPQY